MKALIVWGGWDGHEPQAVAELLRDILLAEQFEVEVSNDFDSFLAENLAKGFDLIVPVITMDSLTPEQSQGVCAAVRNGVGMAGCHGGMCDSFRNDTEWQFMTGGQWVAHPGNDGVRYTINLNTAIQHPITQGLTDFVVESEQYYMHTDPGNQVLGTCQFPHPDHTDPHGQNPCDMPQIWTKMYGQGRVFYCALGHKRNVLEASEPKEIMRRGMLWAAGKL